MNRRDEWLRDALREATQRMADDVAAEARRGPDWPRDAEHARRIREDILARHHAAQQRDEARRRMGQPSEFAPAYAELNPDRPTEIVHVITTLEA